MKGIENMYRAYRLCYKAEGNPIFNLLQTKEFEEWLVVEGDLIRNGKILDPVQETVVSSSSKGGGDIGTIFAEG